MMCSVRVSAANTEEAIKAVLGDGHLPNKHCFILFRALINYEATLQKQRDLLALACICTS